jgi:hypothetical protein
MKKSFKARMAPVMIAALVAVFGFITEGCNQSDEIMEKETPVASDFIITGLSAVYDGKPKTVSIKPKTGKSQGAITVYYDGISTGAPSEAGKYDVTFDVAEAEGFNEAKDLKAGTLAISIKIPGVTEDADNTEETDEDFTEKPAEEPIEPLSLIDFEDSVWTVGNYTKRAIKWKGYEWTVIGIISASGTNDRKEGKRSLRLRGSNTADIGDNTNRIELMDYLKDGIKSISFDYASYGNHKGGTIILFYQKEEDEDWIEAGRVTNVPPWNEEDGKMLKAEFNVNVTGKTRFKIEKLYVGSGSISVNVDNIVITY